jgi:hypothetical protein
VTLPKPMTSVPKPKDAHEGITMEVPFFLTKELVERAGDPQITGWLSKGEVWVAPMVNPDGHKHSRADQRLWRKNRRRNPDGSFSVDPNRNYGYMWGILNVPTSSHVPSDETYVGPRFLGAPRVVLRATHQDALKDASREAPQEASAGFGVMLERWRLLALDHPNGQEPRR